MSLDLQQERRQAHALIDLLPLAKLGAVRNLLEVFLDEDNDALSPAEAKAIAEAEEWTNTTSPSRMNRCSPSSASPWPTERR